jgi:threonine dehydrogenase-like Zn-dependent dehydrogenase
VRAFVLTGPREGEVQDVAPPVAGPGEVVIDVQRVGVCGTDVEFFTGEMQYLHDGFAEYPLRLGHEWMGTVASLGDGVDASWLGRRVTGDTMLGCGGCRRCLRGTQHVCESRYEVGIRGGFPGALAEQLAMPVSALHPLPESVDDELGALVEPGGNALRSVWGANLAEGDRLLVLGTGTIGLLVAMIAHAEGAEVHILGRSARSLDYARSLGFHGVWTEDELPELPWDAAIDASNAPALPA